MCITEPGASRKPGLSVAGVKTFFHFCPFGTKFLLSTYFQDGELQETFGFNAHLVAAAVVSVDFN